MCLLYNKKEEITTKPELQNIYQTAREGAGLTQECAAELLDRSPKSIQDYESGATTPPPWLVRRMADLYRAPWIANSYCNACPLGEQRQLPVSSMDIQQLAIEIAVEFGDPEEFRADAQRMLEIAMDRQIKDDEVSDYKAITERIWKRGLLAEKARIVMARMNAGKKIAPVGVGTTDERIGN